MMYETVRLPGHFGHGQPQDRRKRGVGNARTGGNVKEYLESVEEVLKEQNSSEGGLSSQEAEKRLAQYGRNRLEEGKKDSLLKRFLNELADPMIIILIVAAVISGITAAYEGESFADVKKRTGAFLADLYQKPEYQGLNILITTHGAALAGLLNNIKQEPLSRYWGDGVHRNCAVTEVEVRDGVPEILSENVIYYENVKDPWADEK